MEEMGTSHCKYSHRRTIKKLEVDGKLYKKAFHCSMMILVLIAVTKEETETRKLQVIFMRKTPAQKNQKVGEIVSLLRREAGSVGFAW